MSLAKLATLLRCIQELVICVLCLSINHHRGQTCSYAFFVFLQHHPLLQCSLYVPNEIEFGCWGWCCKCLYTHCYFRSVICTRQKHVTATVYKFIITKSQHKGTLVLSTSISTTVILWKKPKGLGSRMLPILIRLLFNTHLFHLKAFIKADHLSLCCQLY